MKLWMQLNVMPWTLLSTVGQSRFQMSFPAYVAFFTNWKLTSTYCKLVINELCSAFSNQPTSVELRVQCNVRHRCCITSTFQTSMVPANVIEDIKATIDGSSTSSVHPPSEASQEPPAKTLRRRSCLASWTAIPKLPSWIMMIIDSPSQTTQLDHDDHRQPFSNYQLDHDDAITMLQKLMKYLKTSLLDNDNDPLVW